MTTLNNYNTNASGPDIEVTCFYDTYSSQMDFEENFTSLDRDCKYFWHECGNYENIFNGYINEFFTVKGLKSNMQKALLVEFQNHYLSDEEIKQANKGDLIEDLLESLARDYGGAMNVIKDINYIDGRLTDYNLELIPLKAFDVVVIRGYSQGDYMEIFVNIDDFEKVTGAKWSEQKSAIREVFHNMAFDAPIRFKISVNGEEYFYDEHVESLYKWEPGPFIEYVSKDSGINKADIDALVPNYPDYK